MNMRAGDVIWHPLTGEKALLVETADETDGARIVADFAVEQGGFVSRVASTSTSTVPSTSSSRPDVSPS
jgi:hypothetical protein